jgi:hypothetical protein
LDTNGPRKGVGKLYGVNVGIGFVGEEVDNLVVSIVGVEDREYLVCVELGLGCTVTIVGEGNVVATEDE